MNKPIDTLLAYIPHTDSLFVTGAEPMQLFNKYHRVQLTILLIISFPAVKAQLTLEEQLRNFPITDYLNKPIDTLIAHLPPGYDTAFYIGGTGNINRGASLEISYPPDNAYWVHVNITDAQYIAVNKNTFTRPEIAWPLSLLRKEKVGSIIIGRGGYEIINEGDIY